MVVSYVYVGDVDACEEIVVNLDLFVLIFYLFSKVLICCIACLVICAMCLNLYGPDVISVLSSDKATYSVEGIGGRRSRVYRLYSVGDMHAPCGTPLSNGKSGPVWWSVCMETHVANECICGACV